jgi:hypothetical protein
VGVNLGLLHWLRAFENRLLREIFGTKREEITGDGEILHNVELHALYFLPIFIRVINPEECDWRGM